MDLKIANMCLVFLMLIPCFVLIQLGGRKTFYFTMERNPRDVRNINFFLDNKAKLVQKCPKK